MSTLLHLQQQFTQTMLSDTNIDICDHRHRLPIYRNNIFINLTNALRSTYLAIEKIVGEEFFNGAAHCYIQKYPSVFRDLNNFGGQFADFLRKFPPAATLPYLSEVAQFEWGCHEVFHARHIEPLDLKKLECIPEEQYAEVKFNLHSASRLFAFKFPVLNIWRLCQVDNNSEDTIDLNEGGIKLLVIRRQLQLEFEVLAEGEFALLSALANGHEFDAACELALAAEGTLDVAAVFKRHILRGTITGFSL